MNFFFDRCLSSRLARMLNAFDGDHDIAHLDDDSRFSNETPDLEWIALIAGDHPRPILITADMRTRRDPLERQALRDSALSIVFFKAGFNNLGFHEQAVKTLRIWPEIIKHTSRVREPTVFEISPAAKKVDRLCLTRELK